MRWSESELVQFGYERDRDNPDRLRKISPAANLEEDHEADSGPESKLQGKIMQWCKEHGFPCQCFRMSRKARGFLVPGWPD